MKRDFEKARKAVEKLFWDTCFVEFFAEEKTEWGETLHHRGEGETFPCRLTEKTAAVKENGMLAQIEQAVILIYPRDKEIRPGSMVRVRKENGEERQYTAAGESQIFLTHKAVGLRRRDAA